MSSSLTEIKDAMMLDARLLEIEKKLVVVEKVANDSLKFMKRLQVIGLMLAVFTVVDTVRGSKEGNTLDLVEIVPEILKLMM